VLLFFSLLAAGRACNCATPGASALRPSRMKATPVIVICAVSLVLFYSLNVSSFIDFYIIRIILPED